MVKLLKTILTYTGSAVLPLGIIGTAGGVTYKLVSERDKFEYNFSHLVPLSSKEIDYIKKTAIAASQDSSSIHISTNNNVVTITNGSSPTENIKMDKIISYFAWKNNISYFKVKKFFGNPIVGQSYKDLNIGGLDKFKNFIWGIKNQMDSDKDFIYFQEDLTSLKDTIVNKKQELGVYFTGPGFFPWSTFVKHATLVDSDATVFRIYDEDFYRAQEDFNAQAFIDFKKSRGFEGKVIQSARYDLAAASKKIIEYLEENKHRKINLFLNAYHMGVTLFDYHGIEKFDLVDQIITRFPNVSINGVEDGAVMTRSIMNKGLKYWRSQPTFYYASRSKRINICSIVSNEMNSLDDQSKLISPSVDWMSDQLFNKRHKEDGSYFSNWAKIIGVDWQTINKDIRTINSNGKPSLMIIGSYGFGQTELDWVKDIFNKYKNQYNIYYKGHPGINAVAEELNLDINNGEDEMVKQNMHILPNSLASEELTNNHVAEGLWFDKFAMSDWSGAIENIPANGHNTKHDLLEILANVGTLDKPHPQALAAGTLAFDNFVQHNPLASKWWGKYVR